MLSWPDRPSQLSIAGPPTSSSPAPAGRQRQGPGKAQPYPCRYPLSRAVPGLGRRVDSTTTAVTRPWSGLNAEAKFLKAHRVANLVLLQGRSDNPNLQLGGVIRVSGEGLGSRHLTAESFGTYRLTELTHHVDARGNYRNTFVAIPHLLEVPPIQPGYAPPQGQPELAEVIDDADPQQLGRLRVRYYWPVDNPRQAETDWLRVLTPYSGQGKGYLMKPEVGSQVLVAYQGSLAEQPFVLGNLFHAHNPQGAKYSPAQNNLKGIQTAGGNKFVMSEVAGAQTILISNSNNKGTSILVSFQGDGSVSITTNGPIDLTSGDNISLEAKKSISLRAGENIMLEARQAITIGTHEKDITVQAQKELQLRAVSNDLTIEAGSKKVVVKATNNIELTSSAVVKVSGQDVKLNNPG